MKNLLYTLALLIVAQFGLSQIDTYNLEYAMTYEFVNDGKPMELTFLSNKECSILYADMSNKELAIDESMNISKLLFDFKNRNIAMTMNVGLPDEIIVQMPMSNVIALAGGESIFDEDFDNLDVHKGKETKKYFNGKASVYLIGEDTADDPAEFVIDEKYPFQFSEILKLFINDIFGEDVDFSTMPSGLIVSIEDELHLTKFEEINMQLSFGSVLQLVENAKKK